MSKDLAILLDNNRAWASRAVADDADFFNRLAALQRPEYLWIGCSDSRVPANQITGLNPGEVFVHRNVANIIEQDDPNCMAAVEFAVLALSVRHIIVCGHYGCGGVEATITGNAPERVSQWLDPIRHILAKNRAELDGLDHLDKLNRLCELNVLRQLHSLCQSEIITDAWQRGQELSVHAWIYNIADGLLHDLGATVSGPLAD